LGLGVQWESYRHHQSFTDVNRSAGRVYFGTASALLRAGCALIAEIVQFLPLCFLKNGASKCIGAGKDNKTKIHFLAHFRQ